MTSTTQEHMAGQLAAIIPEAELNSWELEELLDCLNELDSRHQELVLHQISVIWPVSHSLCLAFLEAVQPALECLAADQLAAWVRGILDRYESQGLKEARRFMADLDSHFVCKLRGETGLLLSAIKGRLGLYLRGVAGRPFDLERATQPGTDTVTIFLPRSLAVFSNDQDNFLIYKLLASLQWAFVRGNLYCHEVKDERGLFAKLGPAWQADTDSEVFLDRFFQPFARPELAMAIYHFLHTVRALAFLQQRLPGLMSDSRPYFQLMARNSPPAGTAFLAAEYAELLEQLGAGQPLHLPAGSISRHCQPQRRQDDDQGIFLDTAAIYQAAAKTSPLAPAPDFQGSLTVERAHKRRQARRQEVEQQFIEALSIRILPAVATSREDDAGPETGPDQPQQPDSGANLSLRLPGDQEESRDRDQSAEHPVRHVRLDDESIELDSRLQELGREIMDDLGHLPQLYLDSAAKMAAGRSYEPGLSTSPQEGTPLTGTNLYDEWDFRRQGFRHNWCHLLEKDIQPSGGTFISTTLTEHRGVIKQLKRQFEQMRSHHRFIGRQRDGDDIDLDALTEAVADQRAGLPASERLFIRQLRDERDIAALFLVDMSSSTEGWVGKTIKESLLVMAEAMESLGDRYAIYGFSGMRRTRSEVFRVKEMSEPYGTTVQGRIAALSPKDYTRMGPPIRHFSKLLAGVEARVRLLIILTDGKPEDYDDYKGEYAIEDSRHALIEAKLLGIHPFCITVDHTAHDYISHLFGEVNYLFLDDVKKLPRRLPDIYRILTT
ncbi:MAG: VWA domain-containing protein [Desulfobulbaceae bacterium]|nr:MAG: VWA domain-containing protein [Desulfobulbaceae bacterium]